MHLARMAIDIPESWEDRSTYTFIAPRARAGFGPIAQDDGFRTNLVITVGSHGKARSLDEMVRVAREEARNNFGDLAVDDVEGPLVMNTPSRRISYSIIEPGGTVPLTQVQYLAVVDQTERVFTFTTASLHAKSLFQQMEAIIRSARHPEGS